MTASYTTGLNPWDSPSRVNPDTDLASPSLRKRLSTATNRGR